MISVRVASSFLDLDFRKNALRCRGPRGADYGRKEAFDEAAGPPRQVDARLLDGEAKTIGKA
jgi:hypothetical protein